MYKALFNLYEGVDSYYRRVAVPCKGHRASQPVVFWNLGGERNKSTAKKISITTTSR